MLKNEAPLLLRWSGGAFFIIPLLLESQLPPTNQCTRKNFDLPAGIPDLSIPLDYKISGDRRPTLSHYGTCGRAVK
ncbi:MAG: hypothetical protein ACJATN_002062 [Neolewinella sp.]|jgi:hypothetical protein